MTRATADSRSPDGETRTSQLSSLVLRHRRGAWFRSAASLTMWVTAAPAHYYGILSTEQFVGVTWAVAFLLLMNPTLIALARRIRSPRGFEPFSRVVNALEILGYTAVIHFVGGLEAGYLVAIYCALIAYVGVVAPPREPLIVATLCVVAYTGLVLLERFGYLASYELFSDRSRQLPWHSMLVLVLVSAATMFVVAAVGVQTSGLLRSTRQRLREQNAQLEARVLARTAEINHANRLLRGEIEERRLAEREAQRSGERYRNLFDSITDLLFSHDLSGRLLTVNRAAAERLGYAPEELAGRPLSELIPAEMHPRFAAEYLPRIVERGADEGVVVIRSSDGASVYLAYRSQLVEGDDGKTIVSGSGRDITARIHSSRQVKRLQSQLAHSQKMQAVGTLASGIAHDFNNILQSIGGYAQLALSHEPERSVARDCLVELDTAVQRAAELVRRLMLFSRGAETELVPLDLNARVSAVVRMFERTRPRSVSIDLKTGDRPLMIAGDHIQIEQLLVNLCTNACDAMAAGGGRLSVATEEIAAGETASGLRDRPGPRRQALLRVADTGCGMDEEVLSHAFEPFFTTKDVGKGTGLGLSSAYGIVQSHQGEITCASRPGQGTVVEVRFPILEGASETRHAAPHRSELSSLAGTEGILVVDDEEGIRKVAKRALDKFGYTTIAVGSGAEAIDFFGARRGEIALSVVDIGMPGMNGLTCLAKLLEIDPAARVLMASGHATDEQAAEVVAAGAAGFLAKPYRIESLAHAIREILDA